MDSPDKLFFAVFAFSCFNLPLAGLCSDLLDSVSFCFLLDTNLNNMKKFNLTNPFIEAHMLRVKLISELISAAVDSCFSRIRPLVRLVGRCFFLVLDEFVD